jgi:hypothetical protein
MQKNKLSTHENGRSAFKTFHFHLAANTVPAPIPTPSEALAIRPTYNVRPTLSGKAWP